MVSNKKICRFVGWDLDDVWSSNELKYEMHCNFKIFKISEKSNGRILDRQLKFF